MNHRDEEFRILLVEDNPADVELTKIFVGRSKMFKEKNLDVVYNGEDALAFLRKKGKYAQVKTPDLILLDLNLPGIDGREVLHEIKTDPSLKIIPVLVLTSSNAREDILKAYEYHANCYLRKPIGLMHFERLITNIENFWLNNVTLPPKNGWQVRSFA